MQMGPVNEPIWRRVTFLLAVAFVIYRELFAFPNITKYIAIFNEKDQEVFINDGIRMLSGQAIYRDFFQLTFPGTSTVYWLAFKIAGIKAWVPEVILIAMAVVFTMLGLAISRRLLRGIWIYFPCVIFLGIAFWFELDGTHHWFSALAALAAVSVIADESTPKRLFAAGALCALATFFTQTRGVIVTCGFMVFLVWEARLRAVFLRRWLWLVAGYLVTLPTLLFYFVARAGFGKFVYCTMLFITRYGRTFSPNQFDVYFAPGVFPDALTVQTMPWIGQRIVLLLLIPGIYVLTAYRAHVRAHENGPASRLVMLLSTAGFFSFLSIAPAASISRLAADSMLAFIVFVWYMADSGKVARWFVQVACGLLVLYLAYVSKPQLRPMHKISFPAGVVAFRQQDPFVVMKWFSENLRPGEAVFEPNDSSISLLFKMTPPAAVPFLTDSDFTRPEQIQETIAALESKRVRYVWTNESLTLDWHDSDRLRPFWTYLYTHYRRTVAPGGAIVWERRTALPASAD